MSIGYRIILFVVVVVAIITTVIFLIIQPSSTQLLTKQSWCIDAIYYKKKLVGPKTPVSIVLRYNNGKVMCYENARFETDGELSLPGINSSGIAGSWKIINGEIQIDTDTLQQIFKGDYKLDVSVNQLVLTPNSTVIIGHVDRPAIQMPF